MSWASRFQCVQVAVISGDSMISIRSRMLRNRGTPMENKAVRSKYGCPITTRDPHPGASASLPILAPVHHYAILCG